MTNIANPSPEKVIARTSECMRRLLEAGLTYDDLQKPIDDPEMRERLVHFWKYGVWATSVSHQRAREIMGKNFFGIAEAEKYFRFDATHEERIALKIIPFPEKVLEVFSHTHILIAVSPLSIRAIGEFYGVPWWLKEEFAQSTDKAPVWYLIRKTPREYSVGKPWGESQLCLTNNEMVPSTQVIAYTIMGRYLATGERLFRDVYVYSSDRSSFGSRVKLGKFTDGLNIISVSTDFDDEEEADTGLAVARKP